MVNQVIFLPCVVLVDAWKYRAIIWSQFAFSLAYCPNISGYTLLAVAPKACGIFDAANSPFLTGIRCKVKRTSSDDSPSIQPQHFFTTINNRNSFDTSQTAFIAPLDLVVSPASDPDGNNAPLAKTGEPFEQQTDVYWQDEAINLTQKWELKCIRYNGHHRHLVAS